MYYHTNVLKKKYSISIIQNYINEIVNIKFNSKFDIIKILIVKCI